MANNPPRRVDIKGQDHMLAYITPEEGGILQLLGGSGAPGPMGIPSFYENPGESVGTTEADVSAANEANQAEDEAAMGLGPFSGQPSRGPNTGMGIDDDIAAMMGINAGVSRGMIGPDITAFNKRTMIDPMTGKRSAFNPSFGKIAYDPFNNLRNKINQHVGNSMGKYGLSPSIAMNNIGQVTGVQGPGGPSGLGFGIAGLAQQIGNALGASTTTGYGFSDEDDDTDLGGDGDNYIRPIQPYKLPTNPYNRNEYKGTELPINTTIPNSPITTDPTVQDPNAERDYNLSQGLNEGYDFAKSPFAGMSINDTQLLTAPKEFSGVSSLDPLGAQDVYSNVTNDNMVKSYQDSAKGLDSVGADLRANKGYGM